jgi:hypothetical protein
VTRRAPARRWLQAECRGLGGADAPEVDPLLQRAAAALRERPVLFRYCAEEVAAARHSALFQRFIAALTRGGPGGMPRPIEMHAHDPRRYLGDTLAWVHQALASERELLAALFGDDAAAAPDMPTTAALLDRVFESICRPLKARACPGRPPCARRACWQRLRCASWSAGPRAGRPPAAVAGRRGRRLMPARGRRCASSRCCWPGRRCCCASASASC